MFVLFFSDTISTYVFHTTTLSKAHSLPCRLSFSLPIGERGEQTVSICFKSSFLWLFQRQAESRKGTSFLKTKEGEETRKDQNNSPKGTALNPKTNVVLLFRQS
jgi:hypothetical protein